MANATSLPSRPPWPGTAGARRAAWASWGWRSASPPCCSAWLFSATKGLEACSAAFVAEHVAEQLPGLAVEAGELDGLDRIEVSRAGVDLDAGQQDRHPQVLHAGRLLH